MKKLLTMIGAAATAFGLYAAEGVVGGTSFETEGDKIVPAAEGLWGGAEGATKLDITAYKGSPITAPVNVPDRWFEVGAGDKFLDIKTDGFNKPLWGYIDSGRAPYNMKDGDNSLFFDGNVQFTAFDDEESVVVPDANTKLMVWVKENTDAQGESDGTYELMVTAGKWENSEWVAQNYDCGSIADLDTMKRVTIKSLGNIYTDGEAYGFRVYINGTAVECSTDKGLDANKLTAVAKASNQYGYLFPSIVQAATVSSIGFAGQGQVDCLSFTYTAPDFAEDKYFTINWDENVASVGYKLTAEGDYTRCDMTETSESIPFVGNVTYDLLVTYKENYAAGDWEKDDSVEFNDDYTKVTVSAPNQQMWIVSKDATPRANVTVDGDVIGSFATFAEAVAAIEAAGGEKAEIKLNGYDLEIGQSDEGTSEGSVTIGDLTIDLNGQAITGTEALEGYVLQSTGTLTILDSSEGKAGKVVAIDGNAGAVRVWSAVGSDTPAKLVVQGGTFEGKVMVNPGSDEPSRVAAEADIIAGSFDKASNGTGEFTLADFVNEDTSDLSENDNYWIVTEAQQFTVSFWDGDTQLEIETQSIKDGGYATEPEDVPTKDDYTFAKWVDGEGADFAFETTAITADTKIYASWTATPWTITYYAEEGSKDVLTTDTYTIETRETKELYTPTLAGNKFTGWVDGEGETVASLADKKGAIALYATWEPLTPVAKINDSDTPYYSLADAVAAAVKDDVITVIADTTETNVYAKVDLTVVNNAVVTFVSEGAANYSFQVQNNAQVTLSGTGTWVKGISNSSSMFQVVAFTTGKLTVNSGTFIGGEKDQAATVTDSPCNLVQAKGGSLEINGGTFTNYRCDSVNGHCVCAEGTNELGQAVSAVVNGGTFNAMNLKALPVYAKEDGTLTIPGTSTAKFNQDESDYCADGYETKRNEESGLWEVVKKASPYIDPTKPTELDIDPSDPEAATKAQAAADAMDVGGKPADEIVTKEAWNAYFNKVAKYDEVAGKWVAEATLTDEVVKAEAETAEIAAELTDAEFDGTFNLTNAKPGLYYSLNEGNTVARGTTTTPVQAGADRTVELEGTKYENAGFYQIIVSPVDK